MVATGILLCLGCLRWNIRRASSTFCKWIRRELSYCSDVHLKSIDKARRAPSAPRYSSAQRSAAQRSAAPPPPRINLLLSAHADSSIKTAPRGQRPRRRRIDLRAVLGEQHALPFSQIITGRVEGSSHHSAVNLPVALATVSSACSYGGHSIV
jgi:hypothetical protein